MGIKIATVAAMALFGGGAAFGNGTPHLVDGYCVGNQFVPHSQLDADADTGSMCVDGVRMG